MLTDFNEQQLEAASRLVHDPYFKTLVHYLVSEVTHLSLASVRVSGEEKERISGGCLALEDLRDQLVKAPDVIKSRKEEAMKLPPINRDPISP